MKKHERLVDADRLLRRTAMESSLRFCAQRPASGMTIRQRISYWSHALMGDEVGLVDIRFGSPVRKTVYCVSLPTSTHFNAIRKVFRCPSL